MKKVLVSHIRNEEYLLPFWLKYHKKYFDHGVIVDYNSTDNSVEVIKEICPEWDVIPSRNGKMETLIMDREIEDIEASYPGCWKMCLSTTEFLVGDYNKLNNIPVNNHIFVPAFQMVDSIDTEGGYPDNDIDLILQRTDGIHYNDPINYPVEPFIPSNPRWENSIRSWRNGWSTRRARLLHSYDKLEYPIGRHYGNYDEISEDFVIVYYRFSPFNQTTLARITGIQDNLTEEDKQKGYGFEHFMTPEETTNWFKVWQQSSRDLKQDIQRYIDLLPKT